MNWLLMPLKMCRKRYYGDFQFNLSSFLQHGIQELGALILCFASTSYPTDSATSCRAARNSGNAHVLETVANLGQ
jgi:hypothetical protein